MHDDDIDCCNFINKSYSNTFQENLCHEYTKVVLVSHPYMYILFIIIPFRSTFATVMSLAFETLEMC